MPVTYEAAAMRIEWRGGTQSACQPRPFPHENVPGDLEIGHAVRGNSRQVVIGSG